MAQPNSRDSLIEYCLRKLGAPVIEINVDPDQLEDRLDDALQMWQEFHADGTIRTYLVHQVSAQDLANGYITVPPNTLYITKMFPISSGLSSTRDMFDIKYQMYLNDITNMGSFIGDLSYFDQLQQYITTLDMQLNGTPQVHFARRQNRLYVFGDFVDGNVRAGDYIVAEIYQALDTASFSSVFNDTWLKSYTSALFKQQWGSNLIKFEGMTLPGGVTIAGRQLYEDANQDVAKLEEDLRNTYEMPIDFYVG
jgi:hypothetical protein